MKLPSLFSPHILLTILSLCFLNSCANKEIVQSVIKIYRKGDHVAKQQELRKEIVKSKTYHKYQKENRKRARQNKPLLPIPKMIQSEKIAPWY